jgi:hypothetical protein
MGQISEQEYWYFYKQFQAQWQARKELKKTSKPIPPKILDNSRLGSRLIHRFLTAAYDGLLSYQDVSRLINVPVSRFKELES